jgi:hypothetical protein
LVYFFIFLLNNNNIIIIIILLNINWAKPGAAILAGLKTSLAQLSQIANYQPNIPSFFGGGVDWTWLNYIGRAETGPSHNPHGC